MRYDRLKRGGEAVFWPQETMVEGLRTELFRSLDRVDQASVANRCTVLGERLGGLEHQHARVAPLVSGRSLLSWAPDAVSRVGAQVEM